MEFSQIGISIVKKLKERAFSLPGKLPAPSILVRFCLRFGSGSRSRELLPDLTVIYGTRHVPSEFAAKKHS